ncbi:hypothetical protein ACIBI4_31010 [Streptomyces sp. NPDC050418]|uniref:hypothetical protein n=1 Tax=Streptomyces sp. NPDC050418 TaxID=3365612 RepID=UPI0037BCE9A1
MSIPLEARKADRQAKEDVPPWNVEEVHALVFVAKGDRLFAPYLLSLMGLRPAEVCGLRWDDVDLGKATVSITNTRTLVGNQKVVEKDAKSFAGKRQLPLPDLVREALTSFRSVQAAEQLAVGDAYQDSGRVFVDEGGRMLQAVVREARCGGPASGSEDMGRSCERSYPHTVRAV